MVDLKEYLFIQEEEIGELKSQGYVLQHKKSGARVIVLSNDDNNKVFSIGFRTPPKDDTGVPHIIEHSVLCGSKEFPSKDPFVELAKGSLNTFLNAMTFSDKTIYPIASCNEKDFQNLIHVYLDAVFYPNIYQREEIFKQEGWHYELESMEDEVTYNGVVYNEMKGAFSSPEQLLFRLIEKSLFPDTPYGTESGGDPEYIPELSYEEFLEFHKKYYHPSNSYIYLYGDMDVEEKLTWIDTHYLSHFERQQVDSEINMQAPFAKTREIVDFYSITEGETLDNKTYLSYNVVIGTSLDQETSLAFQILEYVLLSAPGAPLKQALLDNGIGNDILSSYVNGVLQPVFSIIAKNAQEEQKDSFIKVIRDTITSFVENGIDKKPLLAAINYFEFKYREADFGQYPKGLMYGIQILESWLYDDSKPFIHVKANDTFALLKERIDSSYYKELLQKYLLDNTHSSMVIVKPQVGLTDKKDAMAADKLAEYKKSLSVEELENLIKATEQLRIFQETPSTKEELEAIPLLSREDIDKRTQPLYNQWTEVAGIKVLHHDIYTNGIGYLKLLFDLKKVDPQNVPYISLLSTVLGYIDTERYTLAEFSNEVNIHTGGISTDVNTYSQLSKRGEYLSKFEVNAKALYGELGQALSLIDEMLFSSKLEDEKRLREIVAELKSRMQMKMNSQGHTTAANRAVSYFSKAGHFNDFISGIGFYNFIDHLDQNFETEKEVLIPTLKSLSEKIFNKENLLISFTADQGGVECLGKALPDFLKSLPETTDSNSKSMVAMVKEAEPVRLNEGFKTSSQVQYVARAGNFMDAGYTYSGVLKVLKTILSYDYLWNNIRVKGGAYGCMCGFSREGNGYFVSYRDPNLAETIGIYEKTYEYIRDFVVDERDMTKYIIGTISSMDTPLNPLAKGNRSLVAYLCDLPYEEMQKERDIILSASQEDIQEMADRVKAVMDAGNICVIGNDKKIEENKALFQTIKNLN